MDEPDAIVPLSAGTVQHADGTWHSTTYDDRDAFGTLGGYVKMEAGALLAKRYPRAFVVANTKCMDDRQPSHAVVHARELQELGVPKERIVLEEQSVSTGSEVSEALKLAQVRGWKRICIVSNEYHLPRVEAFYRQLRSPVAVDFVSAEAVVVAERPAFAAEFEAIKQRPAYAERLAAEARGIAAIQAGTYKAADVSDKRERPA